MTEESSESIDDVRALVAERHRFDEWLAALEDRREETPDHVYTRVHGDYVARRSQVMTQLHAHVPGLEQLASELDARAASLAARSQAEEDEKAEAMLRHAVGEYDDGKWDEVRQRVDSTLATLSDERKALDAQREDVGSLLDSARPDAVDEPEAQAEPSSTDEAPDAASAESSSDVDSASSTGTTPDDRMVDSDERDRRDEGTQGGMESPRARAAGNQTVDWLGAITPEGSEAQGDRAPASSQESGDASRDDAEDRSSGSPDAAELETVNELELTPDEPSATAAPVVERTSIWGGSRSTPDDDAADAAAEDVFGDARSERSGTTGSAAGSGTGSTAAADRQDKPSSSQAPAEGFDELAFLRSVIDPKSPEPMVPRSPSSSDAQKTLRCTECGTMNLPTEWYCERCGGELAAF